MSGKVISAAVKFAAFGIAAFGALPALADLNGPAEAPPAGFSETQFIDSRGCVFLRAGYAGQVKWVPRVTHDRKQMCGYTPTVPATQIVAPPPASGAASGAEPRAEPTNGQPADKPEANAATKAAAQTDAPTAPPTRKKTAAARENPVAPDLSRAVTTLDGQILTCPASAPVAVRVPLSNGRTTLLCSNETGGRQAAVLPQLAPGTQAKGAENRAAEDVTRAGTARITGRIFVQIGTYAQPANAEGAAGRLRDFGYPVARSTARNGALQVIYAGPFASAKDAKDALSTLRNAGFQDALIPR